MVVKDLYSSVLQYVDFTQASSRIEMAECSGMILCQKCMDSSSLRPSQNSTLPELHGKLWRRISRWLRRELLTRVGPRLDPSSEVSCVRLTLHAWPPSEGLEFSQPRFGRSRSGPNDHWSPGLTSHLCCLVGSVVIVLHFRTQQTAYSGLLDIFSRIFTR